MQIAIFTKFFKQLSLEVACALVTWAIVAGSAIYFMVHNQHAKISQVITVALLFVTFISLWLVCTVNFSDDLSQTTKKNLLLIQFACILALYFSAPFDYLAILTILWCTLLPSIFPIKWLMLSAPLWSAPLWLIFKIHWQVDHMLLTASLFLMFNLFSLLMVNTATKEREAKEQAKQLNRELLATQHLLNQATQQAERIRIARNIHDLIGHHLTALSIHLQVAARITEGEAQQKIQTCHSLARLLLSDVREAVSEIREKSALQIFDALHALFSNIPAMKLQLNCPSNLNIVDMHIADCILKIVQESLTNSLKHSKADLMQVSISQSDTELELHIQDNGIGPQHFAYGNGLTGMQERIAALNGQIMFQSHPHGFSTHVTFPVPV